MGILVRETVTYLIMKLYYVAVVLLMSVVSVGIISGKEWSPLKLPHVSTGRMTERGLDYKMPGSAEGYVPDKETAAKIAEVILFRLSSDGERAIARQRPYEVVQDDDIW